MDKKIIKITLEQAIDALERTAYNFAGIDFDASDFYCGITNDVERRQREHKASFLITLDVLNSELAKEIERAMNKKNFTTGKPANGVQDDSTIVYLYSITPYTNQL